MSNKKFTLEKKIFGGLNFMVVFWALLTMLRMITVLDDNVFNSLMDTDLYYLTFPLLFLTVLNLLIGVKLFFPQKKNNMWVLSLIIVVLTLTALNIFHTKIDTIQGVSAQNSSLYQF